MSALPGLFTRQSRVRAAVRCCWAGFVLAAVLTVAPILHGEKLPPENGPPPASATNTTVGVEGTYFARCDSAVQAKPFEENSPILLRIADVAEDGDVFIYEIRYIGFYPGQYDLRDWLMHVDGRAPAEMAPAKIVVASVLSADHDGQLAQPPPPPWPWVWPYRALLVLAAAVWALPLAWVVARRILRRRPQVVEHAASGPTLADQLAPLVAAVLGDRCNAHQKAQLERLLLAYWRRRLDLEESSTAEALRKMRSDQEAGALLRQLEAWLYMRPGEAQVNVPALLAPYRHAKAIDLAAQAPLPAEVVA